MLRPGLLNRGRMMRRSLGYRRIGNPDHIKVAYAFAGQWDAALGVTLNGNDVSALASQVAGAIDLVQAAGANQPLYVGAPAYNGNPSIQFTGANVDRLEKTATNIIGTGPLSMFLVCLERTAGTTQVFFGNDTNASGMEFANITGNRAVIAVAAANLTDGAITTTLPETWALSDPADGVTPGSFLVNSAKVLTPTTIHLSPGAGGSMIIGARQGGIVPADIDFCWGAITVGALGDSLLQRLSHALQARFTGG